jgi:hypothetical protein
LKPAATHGKFTPQSFTSEHATMNVAPLPCEKKPEAQAPHVSKNSVENSVLESSKKHRKLASELVLPGEGEFAEQFFLPTVFDSVPNSVHVANEPR